ncbi:LacI family DNA-binding transcriptional regulator [Paenibacillus sp. SC116]|uniref:LacI family DNA-binding transcriptional regulator n=1 Tax=Paenibacillus sp. SC116 TaxID=2968986 RepID=UPI00215AC8F7|nr:LacI family DNA-binding transcriptional regulator [Paenibacillus sp. SC116]MCR8842341.1 LacI family DNA-binding transcriptional regulator [Paenibacillus sp. SC116]
MANIHDIAKLAGVSVTTVSRVLNNHKYVSDDKRTKVLKIINELNYAPNQSAIDLTRGETRMIGLIIPYNNNACFDQLLNGVLNKAAEKDYTVIVLPTQYNKAKELEYLAKLKNKQIDGIILTSRANDWEAIIPFSDYGSIVSYDFTPHPTIGCSYIDRYTSYVEAFQLLKDKGHVHVAFTTARETESMSTKHLIAAYKKVFGTFQADYYITGCNCLDDGYIAAQKLLHLPNRPSAIFANGDEVAGGIQLYAKSINLEIPTDLAIIGQENQPIGIGLGITTVDHQLTKVGEQACELIINKSNQKVLIPYQIIQRTSV